MSIFIYIYNFLYNLTKFSLTKLYIKYNYYYIY
nr:MAG TPA: hypothetical protein [Caudoviricetes sp.]